MITQTTVSQTIVTLLLITWPISEAVRLCFALARGQRGRP